MLKTFPCLLAGPWGSPVISALDLADMPKLEGQWLRRLCKRESGRLSNRPTRTDAQEDTDFFPTLFDFLSHFHFSEDDEVVKWSKL